jgi:hypothetical protein
MKCDKVKSLLSRFVTCELTGKENQQVKEHLAHCAECRQELEMLKTTYQLLSQVKPVVKMAYAADDFLPQVRRKIRNQTDLIPRRKILPKLIPAFSSIAVVVIGIVVFNNIQINQETKKQAIAESDAMYEETTISGYLDDLDTVSQELVVSQMLEEIPSSDLISLENELITSIDEDDLFSSMDETEQEIFMNQILTQYQEAKDKINLDWVQLDPASWGG